MCEGVRSLLHHANRNTKIEPGRLLAAAVRMNADNGAAWAEDRRSGRPTHRIQRGISNFSCEVIPEWARMNFLGHPVGVLDQAQHCAGSRDIRIGNLERSEHLAR